MVLDLGRIKLDERVAKSQAIERFYGQNKLTHLLIVTKSQQRCSFTVLASRVVF